MNAANKSRAAVIRGAFRSLACDVARVFARRALPCAPSAVLVFISLFCCAVPAAHADYAVLRSGQRLHITGWQCLGDTVRFDLEGGSVTLPASELVSVEPEEVFPASPQPPAPEVPYGEQIRTAASENGIDPLLVASVISAESNFNSRAVSPKSAFGLMQLRPQTAASFAVRNLFDPQQNIDAGTRYLKQLLDLYEQNVTLALAAYNAGPSRVAQYRGVPPFPETRAYIQRVNAKLQMQKAATAITTPLGLLFPPHQ
jgi:hypothetical protein